MKKENDDCRHSAHSNPKKIGWPLSHRTVMEYLWKLTSHPLCFGKCGKPKKMEGKLGYLNDPKVLAPAFQCCNEACG
jgi:hypothetical protein